MKQIRIILLTIFLMLSAVVRPATAADLTPLIKGGKGGWLNVTAPLTETDFKDKVILLDFWTYGCINCMQIIPDLEFLEEKYGNKLLIVGVHSAKFQGEQGSERILFAAKRFGLKHPVVNDSDFAIWNAFGVKAWPTQVLLGPDGQEIARWSGEGHRADIDKAISKIDLKPVSHVTQVAAQDDTSILYFPARTRKIGNELFIADSGHNAVLIADETGKVTRVIGSGKRGFKDGNADTAQFNAPRGFAVSGDKIYIADTGNHRIRVFDRASGKVSTLIGDGTRGRPGQLASPWDVAVFNDDTLIIANAGTHQLLAYNLKDRKLTVFAGSGQEDIIDGNAVDAALAQPSALSTDTDTVFFLDAESSSLRQVKEGQVKTLIGTGLFDFGLTDGTYPKAMMQHAQGLSVTKDKIWIADTYNNTVRYYDRASGLLATLPSIKGLNEPGDIFVTGSEGFVTDTNNNRILRFDPTIKTPDFTPLEIKKP